MKRKFTLLTAALLLLIYFTPPMRAWGQSKSTETTTYTFTTKSWTASPSDWTSGKDGNGFTSGQGVQVTIGASGANATSPSSFTSVSKIEVKYCTNTSKGTGTIYVQVGSGTEQSFSVTKPSSGGTTLKTATFNYATPETGNVKITVNCTDNSVYIYSIAITTSTTPAYTITAQSNNTDYGTVSLSGSVITGSPNSGYRYASPAYTVSSGTATVSQSGNDFTVTPSSNCTVTINFEAIPSHTATFSVNGVTTSQSFAEGATIGFPSDPANTSGKTFVGWVTTAIVGTTNEAPTFVDTATETMGSSNVTYYAVFATATASGDPVETKTQTLQYDTWTHGGSSTDKPNNSYRLFHDGGYVESSSFDLSKLSKVIVYGGTFGGDSYNSLTIGDGTNTWKNVTVSGSSQTGSNTYTGGTVLTGTKALRVTSTCGSSSGSGSGVRMSKVEIFTMETPISYSNYCTSFEIYTITAVSNNNEYGTVSLSGEVITGAPKSGYRYASPAYTVTDGTATVSQSGNDFTVTPASDCTVQINFEAIPTYTLSIAVSPAAAGTVELTTSTGLLEGATSSATAAANAGYKFKNWSISGTGATLSSTTDNPTTVTIGTANATVTATFEDVTTHAITYSVNGVTNTVNVEENTAIDLSAPASSLIPIGYVFKGWRTATLALTNTDPNDYVTSAISTADITYYAVMAVESLSNSTWTLDYDNESDLSSSTSWGSYGTAYNYTASDGGTWRVKAYKNAGMQINTGKDCSIKVPTCLGDIQSIAITCSAAKAVGFSDSDYSGSGTITYVVSGTDATSQTLDFTGKSKTDGYIVPKSGSTSITKIIVTYKVATYSSFCTSVSSVALTEDATIAGDLDVTYALTVPDGVILTVTGELTNDNPSNLIIEDGGQLICNNPVQATMKKTISGHNAGSKGEKDGWYFIATPVVDGTTPSTSNGILTTPADNYDLYYYHEPSHMWRNYKSDEGNADAGFTSDGGKLINGKGYLYANAGNAELSFEGTTVAANAEVSKNLSYTSELTPESVKGFNLVGNPFTYTLTSDNTIKVGDDDLGTYYRIVDVNNISQVRATTISDTPINPNTGFIVQATGTGQSIVFNPNSKSETASKPSYIQIEAGNSNFMDAAYIQFGNVNTLRKYTLNDATPQVYVINEGADWAATVVNELTSEMPVNFRANENGQYTLTVNTENVEMNYLHLIDNMTGADIDLLATSSYTFNAKATDYESRFRLVFAANSSEDTNSENASFAFFANGNLIVNNEGEATLQIFDMLGHQLECRQVYSAFSIPDSAFAPGVYVIRLVNGNNVKTQKVVVK